MNLFNNKKSDEFTINIEKVLMFLGFNKGKESD